MIEDAAHHGEPEALVEVAMWRLYGVGTPRDLAAAAGLAARAAAANHPAGLRLAANFRAQGLGGPVDWPGAVRLLAKAARRDPAARAQLALLGPAADHPGAAPPIPALPPPERLASAPDATLHRALLSPAECDWLIALATPAIRPATIIGPDGRPVAHPTRKAGMTNFGPDQRDLAVLLIEARLAAASETNLVQAEPLAVLRYQPGDEYKPHLDTLPGVANQRVATVLVYLNDGYDGGATAFPDAGLRVTGRRGDALVFRNLDSAGRPDPAARHAGEPVTRGLKWLASRWIRQHRYDPFTDR